jgi:hypothetical protein
MASSVRSGLMDWRQRVGEGLEVLAEGGILLVFGFEDFGDAAGEVGDLVGELGDGFFPVGDVGVAVVEEELENFDQVFGLGEVAVEGDAVVLIEDGAGRGTGRGCW